MTDVSATCPTASPTICSFLRRSGSAPFLRSAAAPFDVAHLHACHNLPGRHCRRALTRAGVPYVVLAERHRTADRAPDRSPSGCSTRPSGVGFLAQRRAGARGLRGRAAQLRALGVRRRASIASDSQSDRRSGVRSTPPDGVVPARLRARRCAARAVSRQADAAQGRRRPGSRRSPARAIADTRCVIAGNDMGTGSTRRPLVASRTRRSRRPPACCRARSPGCAGRRRRRRLPVARRDFRPGAARSAALRHARSSSATTAAAAKSSATSVAGCIVPHGDVAALAGAIDAVLARRRRMACRASPHGPRRCGVRRSRDAYARSGGAATAACQREWSPARAGPR